MSRQSRETLKGYFKEGKRPSEDEFADLIDSALNINDEGFRKTPPDGLRVTSLGDSHALMSFYTPKSDASRAEWSIGFGDDFKRLTVHRPPFSATPLISFDPQARLGVNTPEPQDELDVRGVIRGEGRRGREVAGLLANGQFQPLTEDLHGCQAFEVVAGVGLPETGRFALVHAIALNTFNPIWWDNLLFAKKRIRSHHAYYSRRSDRLQLRWIASSDNPTKGHGEQATYRLQIRTQRDYQASRRAREPIPPADETPIRAYVTRLWFDDMFAQHPRAGQAPPP